MINFRSSRTLCLVLVVFVLIFPAAIVPLRVAQAQDAKRERMRKVLTDGAGFSAEQLKDLEKGEIIVRQLEQEDPSEVAFSGVIKLEAPRDIVFDAFRRAIEAQEKEIATERGVFSDPPSPKDLSSLKITSSEIGALSSCKVGECDWSLSEEMIEKLAREVDWDTSEGRQQAGDLLKEMLAGYTAEYLRKGDSALMVYKDDPEPLSLQEEQRILLGKLLWINDFAPEFKEYLEKFPTSKLEGTSGLANWSNVAIGFKPVIINTHTIFYKKEEGGVRQGYFISKQIYASHYFHSSLALTAIISFPKAGGGFETYVYFESHSRAGAFSSTLGNIAKIAVSGEGEDKLKGALEDTKRFTAYALGGQEDAELAAQRGFFGNLLGGYLYLWLLALALAVVTAIYLMTRKSPKE